jgi:hypothetical protein
MKTSSKILLVVVGYVLAFVIATSVVNVYVAATNGPDRQTDSGMVAFGDSLLFLGVLAVAAVPATGTALFFLRPYLSFWRFLSVGALLIASSGAAALAATLLPVSADMGSSLGTWAAIAPLRLLLAPLLALAMVVCLLLAPTRDSKLALLCASVIETLAFLLWVASLWFRFH